MSRPIHIPNTELRRWTGMFEGFFVGNIWKSKNIDLTPSNGSKISLAKRVKSTGTSDTLTNLNVINRFLISDADTTQRFWAVSKGGPMFKSANSSPASAFSEDVTTDTPTTAYDAVVFEDANGEDRLVVADGSNLTVLNMTNHANTWKKNFWGKVNISSSTNATPIEITTASNHYLATGDKVTVSSHETNTNANGRWTVTKVSDTKFTLDGSVGNGIGSATGTCGYMNQTALADALVSLDVFNRTLIIAEGSNVHIVDKNDQPTYQRLILPRYLRAIHVFHTNNRVWILCLHRQYYSNYGAVIEWDGYSQNYLYEHPINAAAPLAGCDFENYPYIINNRGVIMRGSPGQGFVEVKRFPFYEDSLILETAQSTSMAMNPKGMSVADKEIYIAINTMTFLDSSIVHTHRVPGGVYAFNPKTLDLYHKYALSRYDGTTSYDFGQEEMNRIGAIYTFPYRSDILCSARVHKNYNSTYSYNIMVGEEYQTSGRGYIVTPLIPTIDAEQMWSKLWIKFKKFVDSGNRIVVKARSTNTYETSSTKEPLTSSGTWVTTTSFTSVVPTGVSVGDEVEILVGGSAGCVAHISTLSATPNGSSTITVTIDEAVPSIASTGILVRFENFKLKETISSTSINYKDIPLGNEHGTYLQLKIELRGKFMDIEELIVESESNQKIKSS